jgi:hypothetical protein
VHDSPLERYHRGDSFWGLNQSFSISLRSSIPEKPSFRPSKWPRKLKTAKNSKLPKLPENCFERVGKGGWPPISTEEFTPGRMYTPPRGGVQGGLGPPGGSGAKPPKEKFPCKCIL